MYNVVDFRNLQFGSQAISYFEFLAKKFCKETVRFSEDSVSRRSGGPQGSEEIQEAWSSPAQPCFTTPTPAATHGLSLSPTLPLRWRARRHLCSPWWLSLATDLSRPFLRDPPKSVLATFSPHISQLKCFLPWTIAADLEKSGWLWVSGLRVRDTQRNRCRDATLRITFCILKDD